MFTLKCQTIKCMKVNFCCLFKHFLKKISKAFVVIELYHFILYFQIFSTCQLKQKTVPSQFTHWWNPFMQPYLFPHQQKKPAVHLLTFVSNPPLVVTGYYPNISRLFTWWILSSICSLLHQRNSPVYMLYQTCCYFW